jgi:hypothetical protein
MTMRLVIRNDDHGRTAEVVSEEFKPGEALPERTDFARINPGEIREFWIHAGKRLVITEKPHASIPAANRESTPTEKEVKP